MPTPSWPPLSRRQFLAGSTAVAGAALLAACGKSDGTATATTATTDASRGLALAQFFGGPMFVPGREARLPFGVADGDGLLPIARTPKQLTVELFDPKGKSLGQPSVVERRADGLPRAYFPLLATFDAPGIYTARTTIAGSAAEMSVKIDAPADVPVIQVGSAVPPIQTPTTADARGVNPICTRDPVCPLHDVTVADALAEAAPVALLVASPAFCQIAICGPVLEVLLDVRAAHPGIRFIHAEVYADPHKDLNTYAPAIAPLGLQFEPCLVLVRGDGTVADRIDTIYDRTELRERLAQLS